MKHGDIVRTADGTPLVYNTDLPSPRGDLPGGGLEPVSNGRLDHGGHWGTEIATRIVLIAAAILLIVNKFI